MNSFNRNVFYYWRGQLHAMNHTYHGPIICSTLILPLKKEIKIATELSFNENGCFTLEKHNCMKKNHKEISALNIKYKQQTIENVGFAYISVGFDWIPKASVTLWLDCWQGLNSHAKYQSKENYKYELLCVKRWADYSPVWQKYLLRYAQTAACKDESVSGTGEKAVSGMWLNDLRVCFELTFLVRLWLAVGGSIAASTKKFSVQTGNTEKKKEKRKRRLPKLPQLPTK